jgi:hypothetical protein
MSSYSDITKTRVVHNHGKSKVLYHTVIKDDSQAVHHEENEMEFIDKKKANAEHWLRWALKKGVCNSRYAGTTLLKEHG